MFSLLSAHILFDGWLHKGKDKYVVGYSTKSAFLASRVERLLRGYGCAHIYRRVRSNDVIEIECYSKELYNKIKREITRIESGKIPLVDVLSVLRAFWDDEGSVSIDKGRVKLRARQKSTKLLRTLLEYHRSVGIDARIDYDGKGILVTKKRNIELFSYIIGFSPGIFVGKSGSNIFYGLEKRVLLSRYI